MKKEILVAFLAIGFIMAGALSASAGTVTWTIIETAGMAGKSPGVDGLLGTADDGTGALCNYDNATACAVTGAPTTGTFSYAQLGFVQTSSCVVANVLNPGDPCTQNSDCGTIGICVDCNTGAGGAAQSFFARNPAGGSKGLGTMTADVCEGGFSWTNMAIGTSEVLGGTGGSCMTLTGGGGTNSGCAVGPMSTTFSMNLFTSTIPNCGFPAGSMPGLALAGGIIDAGAGATGSLCGYTVAELGGIIASAGLGAGSYMSVLCGSGTLPGDLQSACLRGASWATTMIAKTSSAVPTVCGDSCGGGGCMAGTAEGVE